MHLPVNMAQVAVQQAALQQQLVGYRMQLAKEMYLILLDQRFHSKDVALNYGLVAETAVDMADALMAALGFRLQASAGNKIDAPDE